MASKPTRRSRSRSRRTSSKVWTVFSLVRALVAAVAREEGARHAAGRPPPARTRRRTRPTPTSTCGRPSSGRPSAAPPSALARMLASRRAANYYARPPATCRPSSRRTTRTPSAAASPSDAAAPRAGEGRGRAGTVERFQGRVALPGCPVGVPFAASCWSVGAAALRRSRWQISFLLVRELAAVVHQEAAHAGELVLLRGLHLDRQLLVREVGAGQLEGLGGLGLVLVDLAGVLVVPPRLELLDALFALVFLGLARCVVVSCHVLSPCPLRSSPAFGAPLVVSRLLSCRVGARLCTIDGRSARRSTHVSP